MGEAKVETPFTVAGGQLTTVEGVLDAGVAAISAPGASSIEIVSARKDIQGNRKSFGVGYDTTYQMTLPAGDYAAIATLGDGTTREVALTVTAGERAEVTIE
jgi:Ca-activated chloride channel family protein